RQANAVLISCHRWSKSWGSSALSGAPPPATFDTGRYYPADLSRAISTLRIAFSTIRSISLQWGLDFPKAFKLYPSLWQDTRVVSIISTDMLSQKDFISVNGIVHRKSFPSYSTNRRNAARIGYTAAM